MIAKSSNGAPSTPSESPHVTPQLSARKYAVPSMSKQCTYNLTSFTNMRLGDTEDKPQPQRYPTPCESSDSRSRQSTLKRNRSLENERLDDPMDYVDGEPPIAKRPRHDSVLEPIPTPALRLPALYQQAEDEEDNLACHESISDLIEISRDRFNRTNAAHDLFDRPSRDNTLTTELSRDRFPNLTDRSPQERLDRPMARHAPLPPTTMTHLVKPILTSCDQFDLTQRGSNAHSSLVVSRGAEGRTGVVYSSPSTSCENPFTLGGLVGRFDPLQSRKGGEGFRIVTGLGNGWGEEHGSPCRVLSRRGSMSWHKVDDYILPITGRRTTLESCIPEDAHSAHLQFQIFRKQWDKMVEKENMCRPSDSYLLKHNELTEQMRMILCQWLIEFASGHSFTRQTYHRSVAYFDFIMSYESNVKPDDLQYVGAAAIFFAAKLEELEEQEIEDYIQFAFCDGEGEGLDEAEILVKREDALKKLRKYESKLMKIPNFRFMDVPTAYDWLLLYFQNLSLLKLGKQRTGRASRSNTPLHFCPSSSPTVPLSGYTFSSGGQAGGAGVGSLLMVNDDVTFSRCRFETKAFNAAVEMLDHLLLDYKSLQYQNGVLAAGVFHIRNLLEDDDMLAVTGFKQTELEDVLNFIENFDLYWSETRGGLTQANFYVQTPTSFSAEDMFDKWNKSYGDESVEY
ncbi:Cyclin-A1 [Dinochytrium kinnereticum]|nr:Cyclin-A1 [Dinochytrium kinnereticum]